MKARNIYFILIAILHSSCTTGIDNFKSKARLAYADREYDKAIEYSRIVVNVNPDDVEILGLYSRSLIETDQNDEAVVTLSHLLAVTNDSSLLCYRGTCHNELLEFEKGLIDFSAAARFDSSLTCAWYGMAKSCSGLGRYGDAIGYLKHILSTDSMNYDAWNLLGINYRYLGGYGMAEASYNTSIELNPEYWASYYNLSTLEAMQGEYTAALLHNRVALNVGSGNIGLLSRERGKIFYLIGLEDSACFYWNIAKANNDIEAQDLLINNCLRSDARL